MRQTGWKLGGSDWMTEAEEEHKSWIVCDMSGWAAVRLAQRWRRTEGLERAIMTQKDGLVSAG